MLTPIGTAEAAEEPPEEVNRRSEELAEPANLQPDEMMRSQRFAAAWETLKQIDPDNDAFRVLRAPGAPTTEAEIAQLEGAVRDAYVERVCTFLRPNGKLIGEEGTSPYIRRRPDGIQAAQRDFEYLSAGGTVVPFTKGSMVRLPYGAGTITLRPITSTPLFLAIGITVPGSEYYKTHY